MPARVHPSIFNMFPKARREARGGRRRQRVATRRCAGAGVRRDSAGAGRGAEHDRRAAHRAHRSICRAVSRSCSMLGIATGKPVVVLLMTARPLDLKNSKPGALMVIWYRGTQGGAAVANLLFGGVSPGGKSLYTWPRKRGPDSAAVCAIALALGQDIPRAALLERTQLAAVSVRLRNQLFDVRVLEPQGR